MCASQRRCGAGVLEDRSGPGDVRRQLLRDQEQEEHRAVARGGRPGTEHLWEGRQVSPMLSHVVTPGGRLHSDWSVMAFLQSVGGPASSCQGIFRDNDII